MVDCKSIATAPHELWADDVTFVLTATGFLYLAVVRYACSREIVVDGDRALRDQLICNRIACASGG